MPTPDLWVLTCAPGHRSVEAEALFNRVGAKFAKRVLVTTQPDPVTDDLLACVLLFDSTEINISKWWTLGLEFIASHYSLGEKWDVLLVETDAIIDGQSVEVMRRTMREKNCIMAGADFFHVMETGEEPKVRRDNTPWRKEGRCIGFAQVVAGEAGIRHDPEFRWWLADDDFEWQHRTQGGTVLVGGLPVRHDGTQGELTGDRLQAWQEDQAKFMVKWGGMPSDDGVLS